MHRANGIVTRPARQADAATIAEIYNQGIRDRCATFETDERTAADVEGWLGVPKNPLIVAERHDVVVGWSRATEYRQRKAYDGVREFSVYVGKSARGTGVGVVLLHSLIAECERLGYYKLVSRIFPENVASRALCRATGFREVGTYVRHGQLDGQWRDVVIVERLIGSASI
jgi:phosphinothricin acetyltransferase